MVKIKQYEVQYKNGVEDVCVAASTRANGKDSDWGKLILRLFCRYYIEMEPSHTFVAVDNDTVVGYVICASDYNEWKEKFKNNYLDTCNDENTVKFGEMTISSIKEYVEEYPAHLHINIHPNYQRQGIGGKLIDSLVTKLKEENIKGLMLDVAKNNEKGVSFYRKCGFKEISVREKDIVFGMKL